MHIFKHANFNFRGWRVHALVLSWAIIIAVVLAIATKGIPKGVEFAGGTVVIEKFDQATSVQQVRQALDKNFPQGGSNLIVQAYGDPSQNQDMIRVPTIRPESRTALIAVAQQVDDALNNGEIST